MSEPDEEARKHYARGKSYLKSIEEAKDEQSIAVIAGLAQAEFLAGLLCLGLDGGRRGEHPVPAW